MVNQNEIRCEMCGTLRPWRDTGVESAKAAIHGVPVSRNVAHCGDIECKARARAEADNFAVRWTTR